MPRSIGAHSEEMELFRPNPPDGEINTDGAIVRINRDPSSSETPPSGRYRISEWSSPSGS